MKVKTVIHPFLFAMFPVLFLFSQNMDEFPIQVVFWPLLKYLIVTLFYGLILVLMFKDFHKAGIMVSFTLALFSSYGYFLLVFKKLFLSPGSGRGQIEKYFLLMWLILFVSGSYFIIRQKGSFVKITTLLNAVACFLVLFSIASMIIHLLKYPMRIKGRASHFAQGSNITLSPGSPEYPHIFYFILDGYPRADNLKDLYEFNNGKFISFLKSRHFFVAHKSRANYSHTLQSLATSLNFDFLENLVPGIEKESRDRGPLRELIAHSRARQFLARKGYRFVALHSGYFNTEIKSADIYVSYHHLEEFELALMKLTPVFSVRFLWGRQRNSTKGKIWSLSSRFIADIDRKRILFPFKKIKKMVQYHFPVFVFAHIIAPHPPFVFDAQGNHSRFNKNNGYHNANWLIKRNWATRQEYIRAFIEQLMFVNSQLKDMIDFLLTESREPPIIIIQGDHGPGTFLHHDQLQYTYLKDRMGILNAYCLPPGKQAQFYDSVTPVNTFRIIFNTVFSSRHPLLEDRSFFAPATFPYQLIDISEQIGTQDDVKRLQCLLNHDYFPDSQSQGE